MRFHGTEFYMKTADEMAALFAEVPEALENTLRIAEMVDLKIAYPGPMLPDYEIPLEYSSPPEYLRHLAFEGLNVVTRSSPRGSGSAPNTSSTSSSR